MANVVMVVLAIEPVFSSPVAVVVNIFADAMSDGLTGANTLSAGCMQATKLSYESATSLFSEKECIQAQFVQKMLTSPLKPQYCFPELNHHKIMNKAVLKEVRQTLKGCTPKSNSDL
jgi:hypothetical protein